MAKLILECNMAGLDPSHEREIIKVHVLKMQAIEICSLAKQRSLNVEEKESILTLGDTLISDLRTNRILDGRPT